MSYHQFKSEDGEYGSFEVFYADKGDFGIYTEDTLGDDGEPAPAGWYWWACFPGCMPDSEEPSGPFKTEQEAIDDAQDF